MSSERKNIASGSSWETLVGYSRAVRVGNHVSVAGTVASDENGVVGKNDPEKQADFILEKVSKILGEAGASMSDVVRTRLYVANIARDWEPIGKAHRKHFENVRPVSTMVEVKMISEDFLVEIEVDAIISNSNL